MKHYSIRIFGKVQGVAFRASTHEKAKSLGLKGWAKNEEDGTVSVAAEGPEDRLQELLEWCHQGPAAARVDKVSFQENESQGLSDFEVRR